MKIEDLFKIKDCIVVVTGEHIPHVHYDSVGVVPSVNFLTYRDYKRGIFAYPEGCNVMCMDGRCVNNHPINLVNNCESLVKDGFTGFILTNSHFVIDSINLFSKRHNRQVRFFVTENENSLEEVTGRLIAVYRSYCRAIDLLDTVRDEVEEKEDE